jgi:oligosaccharide repeat unit polymerase
VNRSTIMPHRTIALLIQGTLCVTAVITAVLLRHSTNAAVVVPLCIAITTVFAWSLWSWWFITGSFIDPYLMFMSSLFLFNAGQAPLEVFGLNERGMLGGRFDDETLIATLLLVGIGLSVTHLGALIAIPLSATVVRRPRQVVSGQALRAIGWILLLVSAIPSGLLLLDAVKTVLAGGYTLLYQGTMAIGAAAGPQILATFLVPAAMFLLAGAEGRGRERGTAAFVICVYTLMQLFLGFRSGAIMSACTFVWLWDRLERRFKFRWVVAAALFTLTISAISADTRQQAGSDRTSLKTFVDSYMSIKNPIVSTISEMGGSMATVAYTYVLVPSSRPFDNGVDYSYAMLTVVPNLFWRIHPTIAHGTASDWLVWTVDPGFASRRGGLGYSCIAEAYLNFGWTGVVTIMVLVGFGAGKLGIAGQQADRGTLALVAAFAAFALKFPRDESSSLVRAFAWYALLPYVAARLASRLGASKGVVQFTTPPPAIPFGTMNSGTARGSRRA